MKKQFRSLLVLVLLFLGSSVPTIPTQAASCGFYIDEVYVFCNGETFSVFCDDTSREWHVSTYMKTYNGKDYETTKWTCGISDGTVAALDLVGDFAIAHYETGDAFASYCSAGHEYMTPFPLPYDGDQAPQGVPIDLYLCLDYFPYYP